jgi:hypothetical protein
MIIEGVDTYDILAGIEVPMTYQEILEGITRHRVNTLQLMQPSDIVNGQDLMRKINEIEWALQALTEKLRDGDKQ